MDGGEAPDPAAAGPDRHVGGALGGGCRRADDRDPCVEPPREPLHVLDGVDGDVPDAEPDLAGVHVEGRLDVQAHVAKGGVAEEGRAQGTRADEDRGVRLAIAEEGLEGLDEGLHLPALAGPSPFLGDGLEVLADLLLAIAQGLADPGGGDIDRPFLPEPDEVLQVDGVALQLVLGEFRLSHISFPGAKDSGRKIGTQPFEQRIPIYRI